MTDLFSEKAKDWDSNDFVTQLSNAIGSLIIKLVAPDNQMTVMDFGAGTGLISTHLAPLVNNIIAVDTSKAMLDKLASKPDLQGKVKTVCQDITVKPLQESFHLIVSAMAMHHVKDTDKLIEQFYHHLKPGCKIALADLDTEEGNFHPEDIQGVYHNGFERSELQALLEKHGFVDIHFVTAYTANKEGKQYPIFLLVAKRPI